MSSRHCFGHSSTGSRLKPLFAILVPAADDEAHEDVRVRRHVHVGGDLLLRHAEAQRLLEHRLEAVVELVDAGLQLRVLVDQRVADQHAGHAAVLLREGEQHADHGLDLAHAALLLGRDPVDQREHRLLDELDQPLEHLRLAAKVAVERRLGDLEARGERRRGDSLPGGILQHLRQRLQDLVLALPGLGRHPRRPLSQIRQHAG